MAVGIARQHIRASFFGVGAPEALLVGVVALVVFGPKGLAEVPFPPSHRGCLTQHTAISHMRLLASRLCMCYRVPKRQYVPI